VQVREFWAAEINFNYITDGTGLINFPHFLQHAKNSPPFSPIIWQFGENKIKMCIPVSQNLIPGPDNYLYGTLWKKDSG